MKQKHLTILGQVVIAIIPLLICILIPLLSMISYDIGKGTLQKEIYSDLAESSKHALVTIPPFIVIIIYAFYLIRRARSFKEIIIKMICMLLPITVFSIYWYSKYLLSPLALVFLPFINLVILIPAWLAGLVVGAFKNTRNNDLK
jgi:hypothetical protein